jgi:hypothetical protein
VTDFEIEVFTFDETMEMCAILEDMIIGYEAYAEKGGDLPPDLINDLRIKMQDAVRFLYQFRVAAPTRN